MTPKTHFIGIEELPMMAIASALQKQGYMVTSCTTLNNVSPELTSVSKEQNFLNLNDTIAADVHYDAVIVGRNVARDNEQVMQFEQLGVPVYSYPAYLHKYAKDKQRILVIGRDATLAQFFTILIHVMQYWKRALNYYAALISNHAMEAAVHLSDAPIICFQGDLSSFSPLDPRTPSSIYKPHVVIMIDIPEKNDTADTCAILQNIASAIPKAGRLIYNKDITELRQIGSIHRIDVESVPFEGNSDKFSRERARTSLQTKDIAPSFIDRTSLPVLASVWAVLEGCGINSTQFNESVQTYKP